MFQLAQAMRLVMVYAGEEFEEDLYEQGDGKFNSFFFYLKIYLFLSLIYAKFKGNFWCLMIIDRTKNLNIY